MVTNIVCVVEDSLAEADGEGRRALHRWTNT